MKVGDLVKLKRAFFNEESFLQRYKNIIGEVVDIQNPSRLSHSYVRVLFKKENDYLDLGDWRLEVVK